MSGFTASFHKGRHIQLVRVTADMCLSSPQAWPLLDFLCQCLVAPKQAYTALVIVKDGESDAARLDLGTHLASDILFEQLFSRLTQLRRLCHDIHVAPQPWIFINHGMAFDAWFELARSCAQSFFTRGDALVGFRDLTFGLVPPLGIFESDVARKEQLGYDWLTQPLMRARDAVLRGGLTAVIEGLSDDADDETVVGFVGELLDKRRRRDVAKAKTSRTAAQSASSSLHLVRPMPGSTEISHARTMVDSLKTHGLAMEKTLGLLREKDALLPKDRRGQLLLAFTARAMLQPSFQAALRAGLPRAGAGVSSHDWYGEKVYVDVDQLAPPERVLERLFQQKIQVVFHARTADGLAKALSLLNSRFERSFHPKQSTHYWERFAYWAVMPAPPSASLSVQWLRDDKVIFSSEHRQIKVLSLEGNKGVARPGWVEWLGALPRDEEGYLLRSLVEMIYAGVFEPIPELGGMPTHFLLRSIALEALAHVAHPEGLHAQQIVEALHGQSWRFLGDVDGVDRFLATRHFMPWGMKEMNAYFPMTDDVSRAPSLRALKTLKTKSMTGLPPLDRNQVLVSEHFAFLCYGLVCWLKDKQLVPDAALAERLVSECLGFPISLGSPLLFAKNKGKPRAMLYTRAYWPSLLPAHPSP